MVIYDIIHAYQPFQDPLFNFSEVNWVKSNLSDVLVPTSLAMKYGSVKRGINIKGWTLDSWFSSQDMEVISLANSFICNIKDAISLKHVEIGFSAYAHPILPLLSENLILAQILIDYEIVSNYFGPPTWFWPPEGAVSGDLLRILSKKYPDIVVVIPDISLGKKNYSGPLVIEHDEHVFQKVLVCNTLLKDVIMNSMCYKTSPHSKLVSTWANVHDLYFDEKKLEEMLLTLGGECHVIARDWENMGSQIGLSPYKDIKGAKEILSFTKLYENFRLPSEVAWENVKKIKITDISSGSWEIASTVDDPFVYWWPSEYGEHWNSLTHEQREWALKWQDFLNNFNSMFDKWIGRHGGIDDVLENADLKSEVKTLLPGLMSCIPWHFLANQLWDPSPEFSKEAWEKVVLPSKEKLESLLN